MKNLTISRTIDTFEQFAQDSAVAEKFSWAAASEFTSYISRWSKREFIRAYVVDTNPELNYGRKSLVYLEFRNELGVRSLRPVEASFTITDRPMTICEVRGSELFFSDVTIPKTNDGRAFAAKQDLLVF
jgi:hypothetical protein